jgi:hypothetical protein
VDSSSTPPPLARCEKHDTVSYANAKTATQVHPRAEREKVEGKAQVTVHERVMHARTPFACMCAYMHACWERRGDHGHASTARTASGGRSGGMRVERLRAHGAVVRILSGRDEKKTACCCIVLTRENFFRG